MVYLICYSIWHLKNTNTSSSETSNAVVYDSRQEFINFSYVQCKFVCDLCLESAVVGFMCNVIFQLMKAFFTYSAAQCGRVWRGKEHLVGKSMALLKNFCLNTCLNKLRAVAKICMKFHTSDLKTYPCLLVSVVQFGIEMLFHQTFLETLGVG